jgi:hypothetical protein
MPTSISGGNLQVDVYDGSSWLGLSSANDPAGEIIDSDTQGSNSIQYRVYFLNDVASLYDTPVLDEVMVTYLVPREVLYYSE